MVKVVKKIAEPIFYTTKITEWPKEERPREKLVARGPQALTDAELLGILIRTGTGKVTAVDLGHAILKEYRSLKNLTSRSMQEFRQFKGLGDAKAITLVAAFELGRRASQKERDSVQIRSPEDAVQQCQAQLRDLKHEVFLVLLLDSANHLLREVKISEGILNSSLVHPREVFKPAINEPAASIILIHNHPSGNTEPSSEDIQITRQMVEAGKIIGIPVHDHIIVTSHSFTSFAERGLL